MSQGSVDPRPRGLERTLEREGNAGGERNAPHSGCRVCRGQEILRQAGRSAHVTEDERALGLEDHIAGRLSSGIRRFGYWIPGRPVPMERPFSVQVAPGIVRRRNGDRSRDYRSRLQGLVLQQGRPAPLLHTRLGLELAIFTSPDSRGRRGDLSNYLKAIEDAFNGVVWVDDRDVFSARVVILDPEIRDDRQEGVRVEVWGL